MFPLCLLPSHKQPLFWLFFVLLEFMPVPELYALMYNVSKLDIRYDNLFTKKELCLEEKNHVS